MLLRGQFDGVRRTTERKDAPRAKRKLALCITEGKRKKGFQKKGSSTMEYTSECSSPRTHDRA